MLFKKEVVINVIKSLTPHPTEYEARPSCIGGRSAAAHQCCSCSNTVALISFFSKRSSGLRSSHTDDENQEHIDIPKPIHTPCFISLK